MKQIARRSMTKGLADLQSAEAAFKTARLDPDLPSLWYATVAKAEFDVAESIRRIATVMTQLPRSTEEHLACPLCQAITITKDLPVKVLCGNCGREFDVV